MDLLRQLRCFQVVAEELHFGRAAERLGIAQPPLSQRIRRLELDLDARLFDRTSRQVTLTEAGEVLLAESRELLARWERMVTQVRKAHRGELDMLRLGVPPEVPGRVLAAILTAIAERHPNLRIDLQELTTAEQARLLVDRQLDAGLLQQPVESLGFETGPTVATPLGVVLPRDSPLAARAELELADLAGHGLVIFPRAASPGLYDTTLRACWDQGYRPSHIHHARNPEFVLGLVLAGHGVAFDQGIVARKEPRVVWRPLAAASLVWRMSFAWPSSNPHPEVRQLAETVTAAIQQDGVSNPTPDTIDQPQRPWGVVYGRT